MSKAASLKLLMKMFKQAMDKAGEDCFSRLGEIFTQIRAKELVQQQTMELVILPSMLCCKN